MLSLNYNPLADTDDGSCIPIIYGCNDINAINFDSIANVNDGSCIDLTYGCIDSLAYNFNSLANTSDESCIERIYGCMDLNYMEFDINANSDSGLCETLILYGCMDPQGSNFNTDITIDDGSCIYNGCTDENAINYESYATFNDGTCLYFSQCNIPEQYLGNTGSNMILGLLDSFIDSLPITNNDAYIVAISEQGDVIGSIQMDLFDGTIAVWGDDTGTIEIDGAESFLSLIHI